MKKQIFVTFLIIIIMTLILAGCGKSPEPNNAPWLMVEVSSTDSNTFRAFGFLKDSKNNTLDANITINGIPVFSDKIITIDGLKDESTVEIIASHPTIATVQRTFTVPKKVTGVTTKQDLAKWLSRNDKTLTLEWTGGDGDFYMIGVNGSMTSGANRPWRQSPATIDVSESDKFLYPTPTTLSITVKSVKYVDLTSLGFLSGSKFEVEGLKSDPLVYTAP